MAYTPVTDHPWGDSLTHPLLHLPSFESEQIAQSPAVQLLAAKLALSTCSWPLETE